MGTTQRETATIKIFDDINNLFIGSASVFKTGGYANPTLTVIALSIRIADQLKALMDATK